jgi:hypothetical protein
VHDRSPGAARTAELVERVVPLVVKLIGLARLPGVRGVLDDAVALIRSLLPENAPAVPAGDPAVVPAGDPAVVVLDRASGRVD